MKKILLIIGFISSLSFSQTDKDVEIITNSYDISKLREFEIFMKEKELNDKIKADKIAKEKGWPIVIQNKNGSYGCLIRVSEEGNPIYYYTYNVDAAKSTRTNYLNTGGALGLNLDGQNMVARIWDGDMVGYTHLGFGGRVVLGENQTQSDFSSLGSRHATHVTGTILAAPWDLFSINVKGMASQANVRAFDFYNDISEAIAEASNGMLVSNHSYGHYISNSPSQEIGSYDSESHYWDKMIRLAPYYLPVFSAGNDGLSINTDPMQVGFDKLIGKAVSKNALTVANAQDAVIDSNGDLVSVDINTSSSQGPSDDRRIKPDIAANGTGLLSLTSLSNTSTAIYTGTSMAAPNVSGSLLLLQQHYRNISNTFMKSSTLKGLVCHTADDAGQIGPDPIFGWGLLNSKKSAETISNNGLTSWISEEKLIQGEVFTMVVRSNGAINTPLIASICWTDIEAENIFRPTNDIRRCLVNDLDIRITKDGVTYYPWRLNNNLNEPALKDGDNVVDNFELIKIDNPSAGDYLITISHKGNLIDMSQDFSLVVSGIISNFSMIPSSVNNLTICNNQDASYSFNCSQLSINNINFTTTGAPSGANVSFTPLSLNGNGVVTMNISNLVNVVPGNYNIEVTGNNGLEIERRMVFLKIFSSNFSPVVLNNPTNNNSAVHPTTVNFSWEPNINCESYNLQVSNSPTFNTFVSNITTPDTSYTLYNLLDNTNYYWRVIPSNRCGTSNISVVFINAFRTLPLICQSFFATDFSDSSLNLNNRLATIPIEITTGNNNWYNFNVSLSISHPNINELEIWLQKMDNTGGFYILLLNPCNSGNTNINCRFINSGHPPSCIGNPSISGNILPYNQLNGGSDGTWVLYVYGEGTEGVINSLSVEVCNFTPPLNLNENIKNTFTIYPNPSNSTITISNCEEIKSVKIYDMTGKLVKNIEKENNTNIENIDIKEFATGMYLIHIKDKLDNNSIVKMIKN